MTKISEMKSVLDMDFTTSVSEIRCPECNYFGLWEWVELRLRCPQCGKLLTEPAKIKEVFA